MERMLLIYNPHPFDGRTSLVLSRLVNHFTATGFEVTVHPTQKHQDAWEFLENRARDFDYVTISGGDGLLHEGINGLQKAGFEGKLCYLPAGTTNDFGNTHHISMHLEEAAEQMTQGYPYPIDLGVFNGEYFTYVAACGVGIQVSYATSPEEKKRFGPLAYILRSMGSVDYTHWENNCISMKVEWEGGMAEGDFLFVSISNSQYIGGSDKFIQRFSWDDGLLEGFMIRRPMNLADLNEILGSILRRDYSSRLFVQTQSPWFHIKGQKTPWTLDGEFGGDWEEVHIEVKPQAQTFILPGEDLYGG